MKELLGSILGWKKQYRWVAKLPIGGSVGALVYAKSEGEAKAKAAQSLLRLYGYENLPADIEISIELYWSKAKDSLD